MLPQWTGVLEPRSANNRLGRIKDVWLLRVLALTTLLNIFLLYKWFHPQNITPLDDFQNLKPHFATWPPTNTSDPDSRAVVSALYNDLFTIPVANLGYSLQNAGTAARRILFHIPGRLSARSLCIVRAAGWEPLEVEQIPPPHNGKGIGYRFGDQYTKLHLWSLDTILGVNRVVYLDADTLVRRNFDELFDVPFPFAAVPDVYGSSGFKLNFNAGVLVLHPNHTTYENVLARMPDARYPPGEAEQAFLNVYFGADVVRLPYVYNANLAIHDRTPALWDAMRDEMRIVHYTNPKPFPKDGKEIVDGARLDRSFEKARRKFGGLYAEAMDWWMDSYIHFRQQNRMVLEQCDRLP